MPGVEMGIDQCKALVVTDGLLSPYLIRWAAVFHLDDAWSKTSSSSFPSWDTFAIRHRPAFDVKPVLTPSTPDIRLKSRFVVRKRYERLVFTAVRMPRSSLT